MRFEPFQKYPATSRSVSLVTRTASPPARGCTNTFMRFWYGCMNEMLLPSGETWKPDRSGFLKKSRNGISLRAAGRARRGGHRGTSGLNGGRGNRLDDCGDTMEISGLQGTRARSSFEIIGACRRDRVSAATWYCALPGTRPAGRWRFCAAGKSRRPRPISAVSSMFQVYVRQLWGMARHS